MPDDISESRIVEFARTFFGDDTPLQRAHEVGGRPYEPRSQQQHMALSVAEHLDLGQHLCIEAPTGVGKTFAYLVPALAFAEERGRPVVISTHTISLQEQIIDKDLPVLAQLLDRDVRAALAKGRSNYLCRRRLGNLVDPTQDLLPNLEMTNELEELLRWTESTRDGSRSDLAFEPSPALWDAVSCEVGNCAGAKCGHFGQCFLNRARRRLFQADVIVANHALFFSDLAMRQEADTEDAGILPPYGAVVLDEAHTVEDAAATHMGLRLTGHGLRRLLGRLYLPDRNRGLLTPADCSDARATVVEAWEKTERFFGRLRRWLDKQPQNPLRYTVPGHVPNLIAEVLEKLEGQLAGLTEDEEDDERRLALRTVRTQLFEYRVGLHEFLNMTRENHVYWFERHGQSLRHVSMTAVPIQVAPVLRERLFEQDFTVVLTSATLAVRGRMDYFQTRLGAEEADAEILDSPFDFLHQVTLYMPFDMPSPNNLDSFVPAASRHIRTFLLKTEGKAFVLFTSYRMMYDMAEALAEFFETSGLTLFVQGEGLPRTQMLDAFRNDPNSVIFGTASFWTGVDVPGKALSNVIIVKLPFAVPDHPLVAARQEQIESQGGRAFSEYALPEAILKFRQGFGRLIRSKDDHGIVVVLDNRIIRTGYGKAFLASIPDCSRHVF